MLDKSIDYKNIIMKIEPDKAKNIDEPKLPNGFSFRFFNPLDVKHWARIEASVLEFASNSEAETYFARAYLPYSNELQKRCLFVLNQDELPIATATAWFADSELGHQASLHWVAVCPEYQGLGIGKAIVKKAVEVLSFYEPDNFIWLHTQTWSHIAIRLYHSLGFNMVRTDRLANMNTKEGYLKIYQNDFCEAVQTLKSIMSEESVQELIDTAV